LIEAEHRRIGYLMDSRDVPAPAERFSGYRRALSDAGLDFDAQLVAMAPSDPFGGHDAAERLLRLPEPPTALFCFNDRMAMGAYRAIRRAGLSIPDDISVVGFDDLDQIAPWLDPPLTTMRLPHEEMGRWAVEYLLSVLRGEDVGTRQERLTCPPVIRDSVAPPRQGQPST
jgi:LacI family transcriptional regulator